MQKLLCTIIGIGLTMTFNSCDVMVAIAPKEISFSVLETGGVSLSWTSNQASAESFHIERSTNNGYFNVGSVPGTSSSWVDTNIFDKESASYRIRAISVGSEDMSPIFTYTHAAYDDSLFLLWNEDFSSGTIDSSSWTFETGNGSGGWGNNELQYYRSQNAWIENNVSGSDDGKTLIIEAREESYNGFDYTSARIKTQGKVSFSSGRIEARMILPEGQGIWPAFWMLGENITSVGWPSCGEIDIMEMVGGSSGKDRTAHGTIHWNNGGHNYSGGEKVYISNLSSAFHTYRIDWTSTEISWYFDGVLYHSESLISTDKRELREGSYFLLLNLAVGGNWPGIPDNSTTFPQRLYVDWINVYEL